MIASHSDPASAAAPADTPLRAKLEQAVDPRGELHPAVRRILVKRCKRFVIAARSHRRRLAAKADEA